MSRRVPSIRRRTRARAVDPRDRARGSAASRGYDADHRKWREAILERDPLCVVCKARCIIKPATVADHITPIVVAPERRLDLDNGRGVCADCHAEITGRFRAEGINEPRPHPQGG